MNIRNDFLALNQSFPGGPLTYLDSAATTLKPKSVVNRLTQFYSFETANVHRGAHTLSDQATSSFESAREDVRRFIGAKETSEIIWTRGTTESINLVANTFGASQLNEGDEIILTELEHHSNIVPWQILAQKKNLKIHFVPILKNGDLDYSSFEQLLTKRTKLVSVVHCSNAIGTVIDIQRIISQAHSVGAKVLVDAAQTVAAFRVDVQKLSCDFLVFSGHKLFGPFGVGVLYAKKFLLNNMPPYQGGGSMIETVSKTGSTYLEAPHRFEAGTPNVSGAIGLAEAIRYIEKIGFSSIVEHEKKILKSAYLQLSQIKNLEIIGLHKENLDKVSNVISFNLKRAHSSDVGHLLNQSGVAVRTGHHCTQILMKALNITGTVRASFSIYNNEEDIQRLVAALDKVQRILNE